MPIVSAFARIETDEIDAIRRRLEALDGVTPFDLEEFGKIGVLIEAADLDTAHNTLNETVKETEGVLGVWPVYVNVEDMTAED